MKECNKNFSNFKSIDRRDFLKKTGRGIVAAGIGLTLDNLLCGCGPTLKETKQEVINQKWDFNPILPIPPAGCYVGTNARRLGLRSSIPLDSQHVYAEKSIINSFEKQYGLIPTFHVIATGLTAVYNEFFPYDVCKLAIDMGVIPVMAYVVFPGDKNYHSRFDGYKQIARGKYDKVIAEFAHQVAKFGHPIVLMPFEQPNQVNHPYYEWSRSYPGGEFADAWIRMHDLFSREGANKNTIWTLKLVVGEWKFLLDPFPYFPPKEYFDIVGWQVNNHCKPEVGLESKSFKSLFNFYYREASKKFPAKPQMLWELSTARGPKQATWLDDALNLIKDKYFRVKGVIFDEIPFLSFGAYGNFDPTHTPESSEKIKQHFANPYFIGSAIKKPNQMK